MADWDEDEDEEDGHDEEGDEVDGDDNGEDAFHDRCWRWLRTSNKKSAGIWPSISQVIILVMVIIDMNGVCRLCKNSLLVVVDGDYENDWW